MIEKYLIENKHKSLVIVAPDKNIAEEEEAQIKNELVTKKEKFTHAELEEIIEKTKKLQTLQVTPSSKEQLEYFAEAFFK